MSRHLFVTGKPGVGKTTLIKKLVMALKSLKPEWMITGFWTSEVREGKKRIGFDIYTINGGQGILARLNVNKIGSKFHVGKYSVDINDLENIAVPSLYKQADLVIVDELGKMELFSAKFRKAVINSLNNQKRMLATIPIYDNNFLISLKQRPDIQLLELTRSNRDEIFDKIMSILCDEN